MLRLNKLVYQEVKINIKHLLDIRILLVISKL